MQEQNLEKDTAKATYKSWDCIGCKWYLEPSCKGKEKGTNCIHYEKEKA